MPNIVQVVEELRSKPPQTPAEVIRGVNVRLTENGIPVVRVHYTADPERDPELNPEWKKVERKKYSSQAAWDREQEIQDESGGGELVYASTLREHWSKIVITDPAWKPGEYWKVLGGFDHGKTNPTALERVYIDHDGRIFFCGEYYMPGKQVWQKAPEILQMPDLHRMSYALADPSIFDQATQEQKGKEEAKAVAQLYADEGVKFLTPFGGNRNDLTFAERLLLHWSNLEERDPTVFIVCRNYSEKPQPGLHPWDCPNLLWELMRCRKAQRTAQQLLTRNQTEQILDKNNHAIDGAKYILMSLPAPAVVPAHVQLAKRVEGLDPTNAMLTRAKFEAEQKQQRAPIFTGTRAKMKQQMFLNRMRNR